VSAIHPLLDSSGGSIDQVRYKAGRVRSGRAICLAAERTIDRIDSSALQIRAHPYQVSRARRNAVVLGGL
jgi:hypothetical protein